MFDNDILFLDPLYPLSANPIQTTDVWQVQLTGRIFYKDPKSSNLEQIACATAKAIAVSLSPSSSSKRTNSLISSF